MALSHRLRSHRLCLAVEPPTYWWLRSLELGDNFKN